MTLVTNSEGTVQYQTRPLVPRRRESTCHVIAAKQVPRGNWGFPFDQPELSPIAYSPMENPEH